MPADALSDRVPATPKGERAAERLIDAATVVLAREGFGGASIARITEEAGVAKRMVVYYFGTREALLVRVVERIAERIGADVAQAAGTAADPAEAAAAWVDTVWSGIAARPEVPRAYFALLGSTWAGAARDELQDLRRTYLAVVDRLVDSCERAGWRLRQDRETFALVLVAVMRGLMLEWVEAGDARGVRRGLERVKELAASAFEPSR